MKNVNVVLTPAWEEDHISQLRVDAEIDWPIAAGEVIFSIMDRIIFKRFTKLAADFAVSDEAGAVECTQETRTLDHIDARSFYAARATQGKTRISYALALEPVGLNPCFDLGWEKGGMNGSGMTFMPNFGGDEDDGQEYTYHLSWDLAALPNNSIGVWSFGEGDICHTGSGHTLTQTFYAAGLLDCVRTGNFGYYWFDNDFFLEAALDTAQIFRYESEFFKDEGERYTIITRHTLQGEIRPGGTALTRSYMCVYQPNARLTRKWIKFLFAHEMVHNWIHINNSPFGICTWYLEGMAEFYSAVLPMRMGIVTKEELLEELNKRADQFFLNPYIDTPNEVLGRNLMANKEMTRVPYGRGFFYLTHADAEIRKASNGAKCLDDVMQEIRDMERQDPKIQNEAWLSAYGKIVGKDQAEAELANLQNGGEIIPQAACFEGMIQLVETTGIQRETGKECRMWRFE